MSYLESDTYHNISIHAPAKGATIRDADVMKKARISIHAPAKGATFIVFFSDIVSGNFNPRSREGSDIFIQHLLYYPFLISIHAPAKGATKTAVRMSYRLLISIHAPAKGATNQFAFP